ncbi:hypothetical protein LC612_10590 [Nostoc sp. CHAB 5834]|nr:hypothetical protein [Nostoc sp. CHAB 5834]
MTPSYPSNLTSERLIDSLGLVIIVVFTAANVSEQAEAKQVLFKLNQVRVTAIFAFERPQ